MRRAVVDNYFSHRRAALAAGQVGAGHDVNVLTNDRAKPNRATGRLLVHLLTSLDHASANVLGNLRGLSKATHGRG